MAVVIRKCAAIRSDSDGFSSREAALAPKVQALLLKFLVSQGKIQMILVVARVSQPCLVVRLSAITTFTALDSMLSTRFRRPPLCNLLLPTSAFQGRSRCLRFGRPNEGS